MKKTAATKKAVKELKENFEYNPPLGSKQRTAAYEFYKANVQSLQKILSTQGNNFSQYKKSRLVSA